MEDSLQAKLSKLNAPKKYFETAVGEEKEYAKKSHLEFLAVKANSKKAKGAKELKPITMTEVRKHKSRSDMWRVYNGFVYDLTAYLDYHPGGAKKLMLGAGRDCTSLFSPFLSR